MQAKATTDFGAASGVSVHEYLTTTGPADYAPIIDQRLLDHKGLTVTTTNYDYKFTAEFGRYYEVNS